MGQLAGKVVILGGGVAGMSAAHELVQRGFEVVVLEARDIPGGKARSIAATPDGLPGEHGFRFFPSFYRHICETMAGIPYPGNANGVLDNLVDTTHTAIARFRHDIVRLNGGFPTRPDQFFDLALGLLGNPFGLETEETRFIGERLMQIATSCEERRVAEYEQTAWWSFIGAEQFSDNYRKVLGSTTRSLVAADPRKASARTIGDITLQAIIGVTTPGKVYDRVLNGPTSAAWIEPWLTHLRAEGVDYRLSTPVQAIDCDAKGVTGVVVKAPNGTLETVTGDWYVAAVPVERMQDLVSPALEKLDPGLARIPILAKYVDWMTGLQFYLTRQVPIVHGHVLYADAPWALTSISQAQFWPHVNWSHYGDGRIRDCLSVDISDWKSEGLNGKTAKECTLDEIVEEVWNQLRYSLNGGGVLRLSHDARHSWFLDPGITFDPASGKPVDNRDPLLINEAGTWGLRPTATTCVPNLFLAADYVQTNTDLACMEGANEAARRAVNGILQKSGADAPACRVWPLPEPTVLGPWRALDRHRFRESRPWDSSVF